MVAVGDTVGPTVALGMDDAGDDRNVMACGSLENGMSRRRSPTVPMPIIAQNSVHPATRIICLCRRSSRSAASFAPFSCGEFEVAHQSVKAGAQMPQDRSEPHKGNHKAPVDLQSLDLEACLALMNAEPDFEQRELHLGSQTDFRRPRLELPAQSTATPSRFYITYSF
jgi:hypothetical protein